MGGVMVCSGELTTGLLRATRCEDRRDGVVN